MQIGMSAVSWTSLSMFDSSSASSTSGMPALTSTMSAPASTWAWASTTTVSRLPAAQLLGEDLAAGRVDALADDAERLLAHRS